jgi:hypothetical protein
MDLDEMVRSADPAKDIVAPEGTSAMAHWSYAQITRSGTTRSRSHVGMRLVLPATMALGVALTIGIAVFGSSGTPESPGALALRHAAVEVSAQSTPQLPPGDFLYTETKSLYQVTIYQETSSSGSLVAAGEAQYLETEQSWADSSGNGHGLLTRGPLQFTSQADRTRFTTTTDGRLFAEQFDRAVDEPSLKQSVPDVSRLSTNPGVLGQEIFDGVSGTNIDVIPAGPSAVFQRAARLLVGPESGATSSLKSALYQVLADQTGVNLLGTTTDHSGRKGIGVSLSSPNGVSELIIDPQSGSALEIQYAPPVSSTSSSLEGAGVTCSSDAVCQPPANGLTPQPSEELIAPIWTDTVTTEIQGAA